MCFSVLECKKRKSRSHMVNVKMASANFVLKDLFIALNNHGRRGLFSFLSYLPISALHNLELRANKLYNRASNIYI